MASNFIQPTKCRIRSFVVNGVNLTTHLNKISVYESIFKPYLQATAVVLDKNNLLVNMNLQGGEFCSVSFDSGGYVYSANYMLFAVHGEKSTSSLRVQSYNMQMIGPSYFKDRAETVQQSFQHIPATSAISQIHSQYIGEGLRILMPSIGPISQQSYIVSGKKPFTAINDIAKRCVYPGAKSGNTLYFRDRDSFVLAPLEQLFNTMGSQQTFIQKSTWGAHWQDIALATHAIIAARAEVDYNKNGSAGARDASKAKRQSKKVFDWRTKKKMIDKGVSDISAGNFAGAAALAGSFFGSLAGQGGIANYMTMDGANLPAATDPSAKTEEEQLYSALFRNGPMLTIKVPINSGIDVTVGKGITANLIPPIGDTNAGRSHVGGRMLVTDLCHEIYADSKMMNGTTTMQAAKGGYS